MISITDEAREKLRRYLDENPGKYLRIFINGVG